MQDIFCLYTPDNCPSTRHLNTFFVLKLITRKPSDKLRIKKASMMADIITWNLITKLT